MEVNNVPLPAYFVELISQGRWQRPSDTTALRSVVGHQHDEMDFMGLDWLQSETAANCRMAENETTAEIYFLTSSKQNGVTKTDVEILDVDQAVLIAMNMSEEVLALDYRNDRNNPRVVASVAPDWKWKIIAPDFKTFAEAIGL